VTKTVTINKDYWVVVWPERDGWGWRLFRRGAANHISSGRALTPALAETAARSARISEGRS